MGAGELPSDHRDIFLRWDICPGYDRGCVWAKAGKATPPDVRDLANADNLLFDELEYALLAEAREVLA